MPDRVLVGAIAGAHGVRGEVRVRSFTQDPAAVGSYGPVWDESGARRFDLKVTGSTKGGVVARLSGVADRNAAEALRGARLYVPRSALPAPEEEEYYHADLIGLRAETVDGAHLGTVMAVHNHGAGDVLEIARPGERAIDVPFTRAVVPVVELAAGRLVVDPIPGLLEESMAQAEQREDAHEHA